MEPVIHKNQHSAYTLTYHIVFVVKYRRKAITDEMAADMEEYASYLLGRYGGSLSEFNHGGDHVHLLVELPPQMAPATAVNSLKTQLSKLMREKHIDSFRHLLWGKAFWSSGFYSTSGIRAVIPRVFIFKKKTLKATKNEGFRNNSRNNR